MQRVGRYWRLTAFLTALAALCPDENFSVCLVKDAEIFAMSGSERAVPDRIISNLPCSHRLLVQVNKETFRVMSLISKTKRLITGHDMSDVFRQRGVFVHIPTYKPLR